MISEIDFTTWLFGDLSRACSLFVVNYPIVSSLRAPKWRKKRTLE